MAGTSDKAWLERPGRSIVEAGSDDFPALLAKIPDPPARLYVAGEIDVLHLPAIAIVGSRNPTPDGRQNAYDFANYLARAGLVIVSGLAQGIDTAAHEGALDAGAPTVAFLGHGIDSIYPAENRELAARIAGQGALCAEYPLGTPPRREHFPQRNRLISGLCLGTLVVEAARRSGSLISARLSSEQGREVFAIPGSIHNPLTRGCHQLIRQGAKLVESADDIFSELAPLAGHMAEDAVKSTPAAPPAADDDDEYGMLLAALSYDPITSDEIARRSALTIDEVSSMLLILELEGRIQVLPGGRYSKTRASSDQ